MVLQMGQFMDNHIVHDPVRSHDNAPVEGDVAVDGAASPPGLEILHIDTVWGHPVR